MSTGKVMATGEGVFHSEDADIHAPVNALLPQTQWILENKKEEGTKFSKNRFEM